MTKAKIFFICFIIHPFSGGFSVPCFLCRGFCCLSSLACLFPLLINSQSNFCCLRSRRYTVYIYCFGSAMEGIPSGFWLTGYYPGMGKCLSEQAFSFPFCCWSFIPYRCCEIRFMNLRYLAYVIIIHKATSCKASKSLTTQAFFRVSLTHLRQPKPLCHILPHFTGFYAISCTFSVSRAAFFSS